jgi:Uma2 family endonuclease
MSAVLTPPEQVVLLRNTSWATYQQLLNERGENVSPRFIYDRGLLEIMVLSSEHEQLKSAFSLLCELTLAELGIDVASTASTTFQREDIERGYEADLSFYLAQASRIRTLSRLDLKTDPPPDLVIEIDITHSSLDKLSVFAATGVKEVWRYRPQNLTIFRLEDGAYRTMESSEALPGAHQDDILLLIGESLIMPRPTWIQRVREWAYRLRTEG